MWRTSLQWWNKWHPANHQERTALLLNFNDISRYLVSSLNRSYQKGKLAITQRRGIISLIPKKDKALDELKNWRPLPLLNSDYKIASKAVASGLKTVLPALIDNHRTVFERPVYHRKYLLHLQCYRIYRFYKHSRNVSFCLLWKSVRYHLKVFCSANITLLWLQPFFRQLDF